MIVLIKGVWILANTGIQQVFAVFVSARSGAMISVEEVFEYPLTEDDEIIMRVCVGAWVTPPEPPLRPHFNTPGEPGVGPTVDIRYMYPIEIEVKHKKDVYTFPISEQIDVSKLIPDYIQREWEETLIDLALEQSKYDPFADV